MTHIKTQHKGRDIFANRPPRTARTAALISFPGTSRGSSPGSSLDVCSQHCSGVYRSCPEQYFWKEGAFFTSFSSNVTPVTQGIDFYHLYGRGISELGPPYRYCNVGVPVLKRCVPLLGAFKRGTSAGMQGFHV